MTWSLVKKDAIYEKGETEDEEANEAETEKVVSEEEAIEYQGGKGASAR